MIKRRELETYLNTLYHYDEFSDYCQNGMQIEGSKHIHKIAFGVSFNRLFLEKSVDWNADALIVHHGIFGKNFFELTGILQKKVKICLENGISLFGIHLPMDAHPVIGHNALLADMLGAKNREAFEVGCLCDNNEMHSLDRIIDIFIDKLDHEGPHSRGLNLVPHMKKGIQFFNFGPKTPSRIGIISGGSGSSFETAIHAGADTFICGDIREQIPALAYETRSNFVNLGHYYSEKPGILKLMEKIKSDLNVESNYFDIKNSV